MAEIAINQLIKMILGILVVVAVIGGLYYVFRYKILDFFEGMPTGDPAQLVRAVVGSLGI